MILHSKHAGGMLLTAIAAFVFITGLPFDVHGQEIFQEEDGVYATRSIKESAPMKSGERLNIRSAATVGGSLNIVADENDRIRIAYMKRARTDSRSRAIDFIDLMAVDLSRTGSGVRLELRAPNPAPWGQREAGLIDVEVHVPEDVIVEVDAMYFDVDAQGPFTGVLIPSSLGQLEVSGVNGELELSTSNRRVTIENITGKVYARTSNSNLTAANISSAEHQAAFRNEGGDIRIDGFVGEISARSNFGRIEITEFIPRGKRNVIRGRSAPVILDLLELGNSQLVISNRLEDIDITLPASVSAAMTLAVDEEGKIEVNGLHFQTDLVQRDRVVLVTGSGDGFISGSVSGPGNIYVRGIEMDIEED